MVNRRKKKCIRYMDGADEADHSEDNLGSAGSVGETRSPDSKVDDDDGASSDSDAGAADDDDGGATSASDLGLSSPGLSLSSLASPAILPSPSTSLASPCPLTPSPATPSSASYTTSGGGHDAIIGIIGKSSLITAQTSLSAASSSSSSSSSSGNGSTPGLPFGLYNMLPGPSPSGSGHSHHSVHHHHHHPHHPVGQHQQQNSHHHHQQQQQQHHVPPPTTEIKTELPWNAAECGAGLPKAEPSGCIRPSPPLTSSSGSSATVPVVSSVNTTTANVSNSGSTPSAVPRPTFSDAFTGHTPLASPLTSRHPIRLPLSAVSGKTNKKFFFISFYLSRTLFCLFVCLFCCIRF